MNSSSTGVDAPNTSPSNKNRKKVQAPLTTKPKSKSIPITNHLSRTESEIQLLQDQAVAECRDHCMYNRIAAGLIRRREEYATRGQSLDFLFENGECIANIKRSHQQEHPDDCESLHSRHERVWKTIHEKTIADGDQAPPRQPKSADNASEHQQVVSNSFLGQTFPPFNNDDEEDQMFIMDP